MTSWPTTRGVMAIGDDRDRILELGRRLAHSGKADSVIVHIAHEGWDRRFVAALRAIGRVDELAPAVEPVATWGLWETEFRRVKAYGRSWANGERSPGVGMVFGVWRHPELSHAQFDAHWRDIHAPLAIEHHVGMWDYTQCSFRRPLVDQAIDYDGVAICQFPTLEDLQERFYGSPESEQAIGEDVVKFGDANRLDRVRMSEYVLC
ncbi:MAG: EthD domain-containing protein [Myxococcota bacterium]